MKFNKVAIIGVGLIGGSLGLALKKHKLSRRIVGVSRSKNTIKLAEKIGAIDEGSQDLNITRGADLVILAVPVGKITVLANRIKRIVHNEECIVIDVGSTKAKISRKLTKYFTHYVGCHPLAGSEKRGVVNACPDMFKNSLCILTPARNTHRASLRIVERLWRQLGSRVVFLDSSTHDAALSFVSHLPHAVAFSLINVIPGKYLKFASTGLRDTTRIAASESELWRDIFLSNSRNVLKAIELFQKNLAKIKSAIRSNNRRQLDLILNLAKEKRETLG